jgi:hypothetical protein
VSDRFAAAMATLAQQSMPSTGLAAPFLDVFPINGAAVSTVGGLLGSQTVSASDRQAARLDELQFDLGEGPCWDAMNLGTAIVEPDVRHRPRRRWPVFSTALAAEEIGAIFAFPLRLGPLKIGAVDMYSTRPTDFDDALADRATAMAGMVGRRILQDALEGIGREHHDGSDSVFSRRSIHQATGMVLAQLEISAEDAALIIQGHAFATNQSMMAVAEDILTGRLSFENELDGIEDLK